MSEPSKKRPIEAIQFIDEAFQLVKKRINALTTYTPVAGAVDSHEPRRQRRCKLCRVYGHYEKSCTRREIIRPFAPQGGGD